MNVGAGSRGETKWPARTRSASGTTATPWTPPSSMPRPFPTARSARSIRAPGDYPDGKQGDVLTVEFTVAGIPCLGLNGGPAFKHNEAFSFQIATDDQAETDRLWNAIVGNGGQESACGWCKDKWGLSWQITPARPDRRDDRPRSRGGQARVRRDDDDEKDRHRRDRGGAAGLTSCPKCRGRVGACNPSAVCFWSDGDASPLLQLGVTRLDRCVVP